MCCFIVGLSIDVGFENDLEAVATVWRVDKRLRTYCKIMSTAHGN